MLRTSLQANLYMIREDQVFVINVVVINPPQKIIATSVINEPANANAKLKAIVKMHKYKRLCEGHHFIPIGHRGA
jgi:hypothetical protein